MKREIIYPKDVMLITGKSERHARELLRKIKSNLHKQEYQCVSVQEFCNYIGLRVEEISTVLH